MDSSGSTKIPAFLLYTKGIPLMVTENQKQSIKIVNGAQYTAEGFIPDPTARIIPLGNQIFLVHNPPLSILVSSKSTEGINFTALP